LRARAIRLTRGDSQLSKTCIRRVADGLWKRAYTRAMHVSTLLVY
jgi:hypothetical protein